MNLYKNPIKDLFTLLKFSVIFVLNILHVNLMILFIPLFYQKKKKYILLFRFSSKDSSESCFLFFFKFPLVSVRLAAQITFSFFRRRVVVETLETKRPCAIEVSSVVHTEKLGETSRHVDVALSFVDTLGITPKIVPFRVSSCRT